MPPLPNQMPVYNSHQAFKCVQRWQSGGPLGALGPFYWLLYMDIPARGSQFGTPKPLRNRISRSRSSSKPIPRWDVHFWGLEDDRKDSTEPRITFGPQMGGDRQCGLAICTFHLGFSLGSYLRRHLDCASPGAVHTSDLLGEGQTPSHGIIMSLFVNNHKNSLPI